MRILEVTQRFPPALGGVERHVEALARHLAASGAEVTIVTTDLARDRPFARLSGVPAPVGLPVRRHPAHRFVPAPHGLGIAAPGMLADVLDTPADVVHAHAFGYFPTWAAAARRRLRGGRLVVTTHADPGRGTSGSHLYHRAVARATLGPADRVIALTEIERTWLETLGLPRDRTEVIPNGIELAEFETPPDRSTRTGPVRLLFVGRLYPEQKGLLTLVEAVGRLQRGPEVSARFVGEDWGGREAARRRAEALGVADRVEFVGAVPRTALLEEYRNADVFVLPSLFEPFGIVLLEAMASGLPIVASGVGGVPEVVGTTGAALCVPPGDVRALTGALERLIADAKLRRALGEAGRQRVTAFAWSALAPRFARLFSVVAAGG